MDVSFQYIFKILGLKKNNKNIILINAEKLVKIKERDFSDYFIASIVVHEINHYLDHEEWYSTLYEKYKLDFNISTMNLVQEYIGCLYQQYSEMHSKYYQEKFMMTQDLRIVYGDDKSKIKYINNQNVSICIKI